MTRTKSRSKKPKQPTNSTSNSAPKIVKKLKKKKKIKLSIDVELDPQSSIPTLLEPFSKDQLINLVTDLCLSHESLLSLIRSAADKDISHRKLFVYGLGWDATRSTVESVFVGFGGIADLNVVMDRATGKCKGFAFITFNERKAAQKVLKNPRIQVGSRMTTCQLASTGSTSPATGIVSHQNTYSDFPQRKIYVSNVPENANVGRLRSFFEKFGEIENGPTGLDPATGKFKGYAIFVFKTVDGAKKVLEEPNKMFEGSQLHCRKASEGKGKGIGGVASITTAMHPVQPQMLEAVAAAQQAQNMALFGQQMGLVNPFYGAGIFGNPNVGALMGGYYGMMGAQIPGLGLGAYGVSGVNTYTGAGASVGGGSGGDMVQGLQSVYPNVHNGQTSSSLAKVSRTNEGAYFSKT